MTEERPNLTPEDPADSDGDVENDPVPEEPVEDDPTTQPEDPEA